MEKYRQSLKMQNLLIAVGTLCLIAVQVLAFCGVFAPTVSDAHWAGMYAGFIAGAAFGVTVFVRHRADPESARAAQARRNCAGSTRKTTTSAGFRCATRR